MRKGSGLRIFFFKHYRNTIGNFIVHILEENEKDY